MDEKREQEKRSLIKKRESMRNHECEEEPGFRECEEEGRGWRYETKPREGKSRESLVMGIV